MAEDVRVTPQQLEGGLLWSKVERTGDAEWWCNKVAIVAHERSSSHVRKHPCEHVCAYACGHRCRADEQQTEDTAQRMPTCM